MSENRVYTTIPGFIFFQYRANVCFKPCWLILEIGIKEARQAAIGLKEKVAGDAALEHYYWLAAGQIEVVLSQYNTSIKSLKLAVEDTNAFYVSHTSPISLFNVPVYLRTLCISLISLFAYT